MQIKQARTPPGLAPEDTDLHSAAETVGAVDRPRTGDPEHSTEHRTTRQSDDPHHPGGSAERHLRVHSRSASTLGVAQFAARSKPAVGGQG